MLMFRLSCWLLLLFFVPSSKAFQMSKLRNAELKTKVVVVGSASKSFPLFAENRNGISTQSSSSVADEIDDDDEDDDDNIKPYLNRTLGWTKRYRKLVPYANARQTAMRLGLRSKAEWEDIREFGKAFHGAHSVSRPDLMYAKEWISWEEFLGVMRPYEEAKDITQNQLNLRSMEEYRDWVGKNTKEAENLRIPAKPDIVYREKGWISSEDFFGN